jgi:outer membrane murein-binding lipoprotein Lpp
MAKLKHSHLNSRRMVIPLRSVRCAHGSVDRWARRPTGKSARRSARIAWVALVPSLLLLGGCRSNQAALQAAQEFGTLASQFQVNTNKLADDIYASCIRTAFARPVFSV